MLEVNQQEVIKTFKSVNNINACLKKCLKGEVEKGDNGARVLKDFKNAILSKRSEAAEKFLDENFDTWENYLYALAAYCYKDFVDATVAGVFDKYAEDFNTTWEEIDEESIKITEQERFSEIINNVSSHLDSEMSTAEIPVSNFMKNVLLNQIFEDNVLEKVMQDLTK